MDDSHITRAEDWQAPRRFPLTYPGAAPSGHYLLLDDQVIPIAPEPTDDPARVGLVWSAVDGRDVDDLLTAAGASPLGERIPVIAYGANRNPHTLALKFEHHEDADNADRPESPTSLSTAVPVLAVTVHDFDVVVGGASPHGSLYGDITPSLGTTIDVHLTLLDESQANAIHESEGVGSGVYECAEFHNVQIRDLDIAITALGYVSCLPVFVSPDSQTPLAFRQINATDRAFAEADQVQAMVAVLQAGNQLEAVRELLRVDNDRDDAAVAHDVFRHLNASWWYAHLTGDAGTALADELYSIVWTAMLSSTLPESTAALLSAAGAVLDHDIVYGHGPDLKFHSRLSASDQAH